MRGSTRKRGSTWTAYWDVPPDQRTGERRQKSQGGFRTQKEAQRHLASVVVRVGEGTYTEPSRQPLARYLLDEWLPTVQRLKRPQTYSRYAGLALNHVVRRPIGAVPLRNLTGGMLNAFYGELERCRDPECGHEGTCRGLSPATRRLIHAMLSKALSDAVKWEKLARNPVRAADPPPQPETRADVWTDAELRRFLAHVQGDEWFALWRLAATTGMRRGELLGLTWLGLDLEGARLSITQQRLDSGEVGPPKSKRGKRDIALDPVTVDALREHRDRQEAAREAVGAAYEDNDLVFADALGRPLYPQRVSRRFVREREAARITVGQGLHVLRHTHVTIALSEGVPLHVVAARVGDDPATILATYAHLLQTSDVEAANVFAAIVDNPLTSGAV